MTRQPETETLRETLAVFEGSGVPLTTNDVAERLGHGRRSTYDRLDRLVDGGWLETKKVGANARVWWRPRAAAEPDLGESSQMFERLTSNVPGVVYRCESAPGWPMSFVSEAATDLTGYAPEAIEGGEVSWGGDVVHPDDRHSLRETLEAQLDEGEQFTAEYRIRTADGEIRWVRERGCVAEEADDADAVLEGVITDVTAEKRSKDALAEREHQFRSLVQATTEYAIFMLDPGGHIQTWNEGAERIKGYETEEILGEHFSTFYTDEDCAVGVPEQNLTAAREHGSVEDEGWRVQADGSLFWANVVITALRDDDGNLQGYAKVTRDMTERREREQRLQEEKAFTESVLDNQRDVVYAFDTDGNVLRWNDRLREVTGYTDAEIEQMQPEDFVPDEAVDLVTDTVERAFDGESVTVEAPLLTADGTEIPYQFSGTPLTDADGSVVGLTGIGRDIRERKAKERQLRRRQEELEQELDDIFARIDDAFFALDEDWRFVHVNERAASVLDRSVEALTGRTVWAEFPAAEDTDVRERLETAIDTQQSVTFEAFYPSLDVWLELAAYPSESGLSVYFRDVTERRERERELELYETIVETIEDGVYVLDENFEFAQVNDAYVEMTGYDREELLGTHCSLVVGDEVTAESADLLGDLIVENEKGATLEADIHRADGTTLPAESRFSALESADTEEPWKVGVVRDVSERQERERELELYETIVETVEDGIYAVDDDSRFLLVNDGFCELTGYDREELIGAHANIIHREETEPAADSVVADVAAGRRDLATLEIDIHTKSSGVVPSESRFTSFPLDDDHSGRCGVVRDISDRLEYERELQRRVHQQQVVTELGQRALEDRDVDALMAEAAELVADTLGNDYAKVLDLDADAEELLLREGVGWKDGIAGSATVSAVDDDSLAAYTLQTDDPVVVTDLESESRFSGPDLLKNHGVRSGISTMIGPFDDPWGILGTHGTEPGEFSAHDVNFVQSVANILASAIARHADEQELVRQREQLAALNNLNEVVREITDAVVSQSTREEVEQTVCDLLAGSDSYAFAWVGEADVATQTVRSRAEAGVENYLDGVTISTNPDDERSQGPTGRAFLTEEMQTRKDTDTYLDGWRERAAEHGVRSSAAIPVVHESTTYGVLNVYTERRDAFEGPEREVLDQVGEVVGHAIAAAERKRALMSDEIVELEFRISNVFEVLDIDGEGAGRISVDRAIPAADDEYLVYGTATADAIDGLRAIVDAIPHWKSVTVHDEGEDTRFEVVLDEPPVLSVVASVGGSVEHAVIEDGDYRMTIHVSPNVDVRSVIDAVDDAYPMAQLLKRRQVTRQVESPERIKRTLTDSLTERQQTTLEAAYHAGFFEWPRAVSGEELADSLGIAPSTFSQHLRKAEQQVFDALLTESLPGATTSA